MMLETNKNPKIQKLKKKGFFGNTRDILNNPVTFLGDIAKQYGPIVRIKIVGKKYIILQDPEFIKHVLSDNHRDYSKFTITKILRLFFGEGLVTSNSKTWIKKRRLIQPAFHKQRMSHILNIINQETSYLIKKLSKLPSENQININQEMFRLNVTIVNKALFSNSNKDELESMMRILKDLTDYATKWMKSPIKMPISWPTPANIKFNKNCKKYDSIIYTMIERRRRYKKDNGTKPHNDLLDMLLDYIDEDSKVNMTDKQLRDEITTIFMAGHDTTAQTLSWILYKIADDKKISRKLNQEAVKVLKKKSLNLEDLFKLDYTNKVIKEGMRYYPSISAIQRKPLKDQIFKGLKFKTSTHLLINIYGMHHNPKYWKNPETFDPERFSSEAEKQRLPFTYLPFGGGPRRCIGSSFATMTMQVVLCNLFKNFKFNIPNNFKPVVAPNITIKPKYDIPLVIQKI